MPENVTSVREDFDKGGFGWITELLVAIRDERNEDAAAIRDKVVESGVRHYEMQIDLRWDGVVSVDLRFKNKDGLSRRCALNASIGGHTYAIEPITLPAGHTIICNTGRFDLPHECGNMRVGGVYALPRDLAETLLRSGSFEMVQEIGVASLMPRPDPAG